MTTMLHDSQISMDSLEVYNDLDTFSAEAGIKTHSL